MCAKCLVQGGFQDVGITIKQAFDEFIGEKKMQNLSSATLCNYRETFDGFLRFTGLNADESVDRINAKMIQKWVSDMNSRGLKTASINHYLGDCKAFLYWCMNEEHGYIRRPFKIQMLRQQETGLKLFSEAEIELLLKKPERRDSFVEWRNWAIVNWVMGTGSRASTIRAVMLEDVDFCGKEIILRHTKNRKMQMIPLSPALEAALREYMRLWRGCASEDAFLFPSVLEQQMTQSALKYSFAQYCRGRGVNRTNLHGLRHSFARGWIRNNGNVFTLQKVLGHNSLEMTRRYVKLFDDELKQDYDQFSPLDTMKRKNGRKHQIRRADNGKR